MAIEMRRTPGNSTQSPAATTIRPIHSAPVGPKPVVPGESLVGQKLPLEAFHQFAGNLAGYPFVKLVVERESGVIHFLNHNRYSFHVDYIAEKILETPIDEVNARIDEFNRQFYLSGADERRYYLGILALHSKADGKFFTLETVEIDNMNEEMIRYFYDFVKTYVDPAAPLYFKPANHLQEKLTSNVDALFLPRVYNHELFASSDYVPLNPGVASGRLRYFTNEQDYRTSIDTIEWFDILVMPRVPDDIPRVAGVINAEHTTPLSHTNVLAAGWRIPNATQLGIGEKIIREELDGQWVHYKVDVDAPAIELTRSDRPSEVPQRPAWSMTRIKLEEPETINTPIAGLADLRMGDRFKYGTKAANLGELYHILGNGSSRLLGFYRIPRPPRPNLLGHLADFLGAREGEDLGKRVAAFLRDTIRIPRGIAIPFSVQQEFLESSAKIQQMIGKLKMAIELNAREIDPLCLRLQQMIRTTRIPEHLRYAIDAQIAESLGGVSSFVVRSSSNAEDLQEFSAAGIYESINHVTSADRIFESVKEVWASLVSPRSVRLRNQAGISLDDSYMGVIIQEEVQAEMGGVLVTTNPLNRGTDFRNVYINASAQSVQNVVDGSELPNQYLYNTVEGGGRTLSIGKRGDDLTDAQKGTLQRLAFAGRLLQSHFSPDYTFSRPVDIEWVANGDTIHVLQLRPYAK